MRVKSYAKVNLYLEVLNIRKDKYHNIITLFEKLDLHDDVIIKLRRDNKILVTCSSKSVPSGEKNLAFRAASLLRQVSGVEKGADIHILKRIPVAAGLGGGSSNAAAALWGLNRLWKLKFSRKRLVSLALKVGCDVPFFLYDASFALGTGRGDKIKPLPGIKTKFWHVLAAPQLAVSTPQVYKELDRQGYAVKKTPKTRLTNPRNNVKILLLALNKGGQDMPGGLLFNRLEEATFRLYPQVRKIKDELRKAGLEPVLMSGSGPAIFGIVSSRKEGESLCRQLSRCVKSRYVATRTV